ncbi:MAG: hypothetical protein ACM3X9_06215 [Bacillota bacterium]
MEHFQNSQRELNYSGQKNQVKYRYGHFNLYNYKDPYGNTIQVVRPAIVKIETE